MTSAYTTPKKLLDSIGSAELARQLLGRYDYRLLSQELLTAAIDNADLSEFSEEEQQIAGEAVAKVEALITEASLQIDDAIRHVVDLPLGQSVIDASALQGIAKDLFIYELSFEVTEAETTRYRAANAKLKEYGEGKRRLAIEAEPPIESPHSVIVTAKPRSRYNWSGY